MAGCHDYYSLVLWDGLSGVGASGRAGGTHKYDGYVDMATIGQTDKNVTLWTLRDFTVTRQVARGPYRSAKTKKQYDCRNNRSRLLFSKYYVEQMGKGRLVHQGKGTKQ